MYIVPPPARLCVGILQVMAWPLRTRSTRARDRASWVGSQNSAGFSALPILGRFRYSDLKEATALSPKLRAYDTRKRPPYHGFVQVLFWGVE